ncbi:MAG: hypothetical protein QG587_1314, partial [Chloroflexota bacterium]|nr:hypothetical protein [Chloroflexota bacterium]
MRVGRPTSLPPNGGTPGALHNTLCGMVHNKRHDLRPGSFRHPG